MNDVADYLPALALAYGFYVTGLFSPGPNILGIVSTSMNAGRQAGQAQALGVATGSVMWGVLSWTGITTLLALYPGVLVAVKYAGGAYLAWLAYRAFRSAAANDAPAEATVVSATSPFSYYRRGLLIQMTNPKAMFFWIAVLALAVGNGAPFWVGTTIIVVTGITSIAGHLAYAFLFSTGGVVAGYRKARRWIEGALGIFFSFAAFKLVTSEV